MKGENNNSHLQVPMENTSAMTVIHCIYKLLKILPCFIFFQSSFTCLAQEKSRDSVLSSKENKKSSITVETSEISQFCQIVLHQSQTPKRCKFLSC